MEVVPSHGLSEERILQMVREGIEHGRDDMERRWLVEARTEVDIVLNAAAKAVGQAREAGLAEDRLGRFEEQLRSLARARDGEDPGAVRAALKEFNAGTEDVAATIMDAAVRRALTGRKEEEA